MARAYLSPYSWPYLLTDRMALWLSVATPILILVKNFGAIDITSIPTPPATMPLPTRSIVD